MMRRLFLLLTLAGSLAATAQMKEGRVVYERTVQLPQRNFSNIDPEVARQIPRSITAQFELLFSPGQSLWQYLPSAAAEDVSTFSAPGMVLRFNAGGNEVSFVDLQKGIRIDQREIMDQTFLVTDTIAKASWKLSDETKKILNYTVHKATTTRVVNRPRISMENGEMKREMVTDTVPVVAWYTTEIPVPTGPDFQGQLPGLILELETNKGQTVTRAVEVSPKVNLARIKEPKGGKRVTAEAFRAESEKLMEEMRKNMPAIRGNVIRVN